MTDREDFLTWVKATLYQAELALHNGDPAPRRARWSRGEPVSILGAWRNAYGQKEIDALCAHLGKTFSHCARLGVRVLGISLVLGAAACDAMESEVRLAIVVTDSAGIAIIDNDLTRLSSTCAVSPDRRVVIGSVDGPPEYQLYRVFGARRLSDGRIALVNQGSQQIRYFDSQGRFLMSAGAPGEGPGEFRAAFQLWPTRGDTLWVGDFRPQRFNVFSPSGEWHRTVQPSPSYLNPSVYGVLDTGVSLVSEAQLAPRAPAGVFSPRSTTIVVHDDTGAIIDTLGTFEAGRWGRMSDAPNAVTLYPLFEASTEVSALGSSVVVGHESMPEVLVYEMQDRLELRRIIRWNPVWDRTVTPDDVDAERRKIEDQYRDLDADMRSQLMDPLIHPERPVADQFPAFRTVMLGRDGRIWVQEYQRPRAPESGQWLAFDAEGVFECTAVIEGYAEILEFGADYFLAEERDDLGVERVHLRHLDEAL